MLIGIVLTFVLPSLYLSNIDACLVNTQYPQKSNYNLEGITIAKVFNNLHYPLIPNLMKLGDGAYGVVYKANIIDKDTKNITKSALKACKVENEAYTNMELDIFQNVVNSYPLLYPQFYGCITNTSKDKVLVFQEYLDDSLYNYIRIRQNLHNKEIFKVFHNKSFETNIGILLMMAMSVFALHKNNYGHFDIKPENFMVREAEYPLVKLIDFGFVTNFDTTKNGSQTTDLKGTIEYLDPHMVAKFFNKNMDISPKSDIYCLGLTFHAVVHNIYDIYLPEDASIKSLFRDTLRRYELIKKRYNDFLKNYDEHKSELTILNKLILQMIDQNQENRPDISTVVIILKNLLEIIKPDSKYLPSYHNSLMRELKIEKTGNIYLYESESELTNSSSFEIYSSDFNEIENQSEDNKNLKGFKIYLKYQIDSFRMEKMINSGLRIQPANQYKQSLMKRVFLMNNKPIKPLIGEPDDSINYEEALFNEEESKTIVKQLITNQTDSNQKMINPKLGLMQNHHNQVNNLNQYASKINKNPFYGSKMPENNVIHENMNGNTYMNNVYTVNLLNNQKPVIQKDLIKIIDMEETKENSAKKRPDILI